MTKNSSVRRWSLVKSSPSGSMYPSLHDIGSRGTPREPTVHNSVHKLPRVQKTRPFRRHILCTMAGHVPRYLLAAALFLALGVPVLAQTGAIEGTVVDARDGTPLEKVSVRVHDTDLATLTTNEGRFQLDGVP